jgi:hypothetical protein
MRQLTQKTHCSEPSTNPRDRILLGLKVLSAVTYGADCDERDVKELRGLAEREEERQMPLDDFACTVIRREIQSWKSMKADAVGV